MTKSRDNTLPIQSRIINFIKQNNLTVSELERRIGIPHSITNILHGRSKNPNSRTIKAIAKVLNCSIELLLSDIEVAELPCFPVKPQVIRVAAEALLNMLPACANPPSLQTFLQSLDEIYQYTVTNNAEIINEHFINWYVKQHWPTSY